MCIDLARLLKLPAKAHEAHQYRLWVGNEYDHAFIDQFN
jgi:hypothetical protein